MWKIVVLINSVYMKSKWIENEIFNSGIDKELTISYESKTHFEHTHTQNHIDITFRLI